MFLVRIQTTTLRILFAWLFDACKRLIIIFLLLKFLSRLNAWIIFMMQRSKMWKIQKSQKRNFSITWSTIFFFYKFKEFLNWRNLTSLDWHFINYIFSPEDLGNRHCYCDTSKVTQTSLDFSYSFAHSGVNVSVSGSFSYRFAGSHKRPLPLPRLCLQERFFLALE